nr:glutathione S-transferase C-terminal domain-containing protein-like [Lytechinus pictus]
MCDNITKMEKDKETEDVHRDTLYLECSSDSNFFTVPSLIVIFIQQYCHYDNLDIILVSRNQQEQKSSPKSGLNKNCLDGNPGDKHDLKQNLLAIPKCFEFSVLNYVCLPRVVQDCQLPSVLLPGKQFCVSGLANVCRRIIQAAVPLEPHRNLVTLLGFRQTCLKTCSESSIWTKLCEVDAPDEITNYLKKPLEQSSCPMCVSKFQEILSQPVSAFNSEKMRRKMLKNKQKNGTTDGGDGRSDVDRKSDENKTAVKRENDGIGGEADDEEMHPGNDMVTCEEGKNEELTSEFTTKLNLRNKKEIRRRKREQNQKNSARDHIVPSRDVSATSNVHQSTTDTDGAIGRVETVDEISSKSEDGSMRRKRKQRNKKKIHKDSLPELTHLFVHDVDVTLADFTLFVPIHLWLHTSTLNGTSHAPYRSVPLVLDWYQRMWNVPLVRQVASTCLGLREVDIMSLKETTSDIGEISKTDSFISEEDVRPHIGNLGVSRGVMRELLKKALPNVILTLEDEGLNAGFLDHPSKNTSLDWRNMHAAVSPIEGEVEARRARGKENQIESIVTAVQQIAKPGSRILDFCSGGGHLGIALAYCLPDCRVIMIENKEESLRRALGRVQTLKLQNVTIYLSNIDYFYGQFDIGVSLHACGVATDIVLSKCLEQNASFVSSPCCYGSIHNTHHMTYPRSRVFKGSSISKKDYLLVAHGADQTCWDFDSHLAKQGKRCMGYIDRDRAEFAREYGYQVTICSLIPETCSPKNNLLIGVSPLHRQDHSA